MGLKIVKAILIAIGLACIVFTILPPIGPDMKWVKMMDFPRVQFLGTAVVTLAIYAWLNNYRNTWQNLFMLALAGTVIFQAAIIGKYTTLWPEELPAASIVKEQNRIRIVLANVYQYNRKAEKALKVIREADPDIILAMETDSWWEKNLRTFKETHPYSVEVPLNNTYGMLLYSRYPLIDEKVRYMVVDTIPSIHTWVEIPSGERFYLHCMHPYPPKRQTGDAPQERNQALLVLGKEMKAQNYPTVVAGDFNDVSWSNTSELFKVGTKLLDPRIGRGFYNTFNAKIPIAVSWPLDHVFCTSHFTLVEMHKLDKIGSDHFPIMYELQLEFTTDQMVK